MPLKGNINHSIVFWCFNVAGDKWDMDRTCEVAKQLGVKSIELSDPDTWPTIRKHGLTSAIAMNGMPRTGDRLHHEDDRRLRRLRHPLSDRLHRL